MASTLAETMADERVDWGDLHRDYHPVLEMVRVLIGLVPNCDPYLEIWTPGFRTYNLIVPNFLNLPASLAGAGAPKDLVGLGMYTSSRAAGCAYCSAHTCSFALRRGSSTDAVTGESRTPTEAAVVALAEALSTVPHSYDPSLDDELAEHLSRGEAEWVVMGIAMMGFLNKFMDGLGVELEQSAIDDVAELIEPTGWAAGQHQWAADGDLRPRPGTEGPKVDSLSTAVPVVRNALGAGPPRPGLDRRHTEGRGRGSPAAGHRRLRRAVARDDAPRSTPPGPGRGPPPQPGPGPVGARHRHEGPRRPRRGPAAGQRAPRAALA